MTLHLRSCEPGQPESVSGWRPIQGCPKDEAILIVGDEWWLHGLGEWIVICENCAKTHEIIVRPREATT